MGSNCSAFDGAGAENAETIARTARVVVDRIIIARKLLLG
jgi:hypothetical protein